MQVTEQDETSRAQAKLSRTWRDNTIIRQMSGLADRPDALRQLHLDVLRHAGLWGLKTLWRLALLVVLLLNYLY